MEKDYLIVKAVDSIVSNDIPEFEYNILELKSNKSNLLNSDISLLVNNIILFERLDMMKYLLNNEISNIYFKDVDYLLICVDTIIEFLKNSKRVDILSLLVIDNRFEKNLNNFNHLNIERLKSYYKKHFLKEIREKKINKIFKL
jgi:hypothetical protein